MTHILDKPELVINENHRQSVYVRQIRKTNRSINYVPKQPRLYEKFFIDEYLFLPIELEQFKTDREHKFYGFRYLFSSPGNIGLYFNGLEYPQLAMSEIDLELDVYRIRYYINDKMEIVIDRMCDPLYPPTKIEIQGSAAIIGNDTLEYIDQTLSNLNAFYIDKRV